VHLQLFGSPRILRDGKPVTFDTRKAVALLAPWLSPARGTDANRWPACCLGATSGAPSKRSRRHCP
jgi:hypothetical protein